jgi:hypothetical protein
LEQGKVIVTESLVCRFVKLSKSKHIASSQELRMKDMRSYLPKPLAEQYLKFSTVPWKHNGMNWFRVGRRQLENDCSKAGFVKVENPQSEIWL